MSCSCYCRNRINHHSHSIGFMAVSARRLVSYKSQWQFHRSKRPTGPSSRSSPFDIHLDLYPDRHLPTAFRVGPLRSRSGSHQVKRDDFNIQFVFISNYWLSNVLAAQSTGNRKWTTIDPTSSTCSPWDCLFRWRPSSSPTSAFYSSSTR